MGLAYVGTPGTPTPTGLGILLIVHFARPGCRTA